MCQFPRTEMLNLGNYVCSGHQQGLEIGNM